MWTAAEILHSGQNFPDQRRPDQVCGSQSTSISRLTTPKIFHSKPQPINSPLKPFVHTFPFSSETYFKSTNLFLFLQLYGARSHYFIHTQFPYSTHFNTPPRTGKTRPIPRISLTSQFSSPTICPYFFPTVSPCFRINILKHLPKLP